MWECSQSGHLHQIHINLSLEKQRYRYDWAHMRMNMEANTMVKKRRWQKQTKQIGMLEILSDAHYKCRSRFLKISYNHYAILLHNGFSGYCLYYQNFTLHNLSKIVMNLWVNLFWNRIYDKLHDSQSIHDSINFLQFMWLLKLLSPTDSFLIVLIKHLH